LFFLYIRKTSITSKYFAFKAFSFCFLKARADVLHS
jgi:hypothetical protein